MKTILVTGGAGYIGSIVARRLLEKNYNVVIFDDLQRGNGKSLPRNTRFIQGDIGDKGSVYQLLDSRNIDAVMHFAAFAYVGESVEKPGLYFQNNIEKNIRFLDALHKHGMDKIVFSSSCAVYGVPEQSPITEKETKKPVNPYGFTKHAVEEMLEWYHRSNNWQYVSLRYFNAAGAAYGIGEDHHPETHLIPLVLRAALKGQPIRIFGTDYPTRDGTCIRDYIHVLDLADAHIAAMESVFAGKSGIFNLGTGMGYSVKEVVELAHSITGRNIPVILDERRPGDPPELVASAEKAEQELGWKARYAIEDIINHAWEWHSRNPHGY